MLGMTADYWRLLLECEADTAGFSRMRFGFVWAESAADVLILL